MPAVSVVVLIRLLAMAFAIVLLVALWQVLADRHIATSFATPLMVAVAIGFLVLTGLVYRLAPALVRRLTPPDMNPSEQMDPGALFACGAALLGIWELLSAIPLALYVFGIWLPVGEVPRTPTGYVVAEPIIRSLAGIFLIVFAGRLGRWFRRSVNPPLGP